VAGSVAEFRINISNLSEGIHEYSFEAEPSKIGINEQLDGLIKIEAKLDKSLRQILLKSEIQAEGVFVCDRCLEEFHRKLDVKYSMIYIQGNRSTADIKKEEEIQVLSADTNYIDLDDDIRQCVLLAIPQKLLCREDCNGLCPTCGVNRNTENCSCGAEAVDTRWDALKKLSHN
jgi:uncharacterized protein